MRKNREKDVANNKTEERCSSSLSLQAELLHCVIEADVKMKNIQADTEMGKMLQNNKVLLPEAIVWEWLS